jgi:tRNA(Leu) C34 or U34 (ribose-2'-O)-methylase TrmL
MKAGSKHLSLAKPIEFRERSPSLPRNGLGYVTELINARSYFSSAEMSQQRSKGKHLTLMTRKRTDTEHTS